MVAGIYKIVNIINGKMYIGQAQDIKVRWSRHRNDLSSNEHGNPHFLRAYNKYGKENFKFSILEEVENVDSLVLLKILLKEREQHYIDSHDWDNLYNICPVSGSCLGVKRTKETKEKMSGKNHRLYGKTRSKKVKDKISKAHN